MSAAAAAAAKSTIAVKLKRKRTTTEFDGPVLMRFPHGPPEQLTKPDLAGDIEFKMYAHTEDRKVGRHHTTHARATLGARR